MTAKQTIEAGKAILESNSVPHVSRPSLSTRRINPSHKALSSGRTNSLTVCGPIVSTSSGRACRIATLTCARM